MTQERAPPILTYRLEERGLVDAAGADGRLMLHNGCLAVQWSGGTNLLVFREGTATWDSAASALRYRDRIFRVGAAIRVSGSPTGGIGVVPPSREAIARCGGGPIWIVANLESGG